MILTWCRRFGLAFSAVMVFASAAHAEPRVAAWKAAGADERAVLKIYLIGVSDGLAWANAELEGDGKPPLFCVPDELSLTVDQTQQIFESEIRSQTELGIENEDWPLTSIMSLAMQRTFPCSGE